MVRSGSNGNVFRRSCGDNSAHVYPRTLGGALVTLQVSTIDCGQTMCEYSFNMPNYTLQNIVDHDLSLISGYIGEALEIMRHLEQEDEIYPADRIKYGEKGCKYLTVAKKRLDEICEQIKATENPAVLSSRLWEMESRRSLSQPLNS